MGELTKDTRKRIDLEAEVSLNFTLNEWKLIKDMPCLDDDLRRKLPVVKAKGVVTRVKLTLDDWKRLQEHVATGAIHCKDKGVAGALDGIGDMIQRELLDKYEGKDS